MAEELIFYTNPISRGQIVRWMLEEVGVPYELAYVDIMAGEQKKGDVAKALEGAKKLDEAVRAAAQTALAATCGTGLVTCRFTHLYPDGPAPYYTVIAQGTPGQQVAQWDAIKAAVSTALVENGATITHHHAVGKDHRSYYFRQGDPLARGQRQQ